MLLIPSDVSSEKHEESISLTTDSPSNALSAVERDESSRICLTTLQAMNKVIQKTFSSSQDTQEHKVALRQRADRIQRFSWSLLQSGAFNFSLINN